MIDVPRAEGDDWGTEAEMTVSVTEPTKEEGKRTRGQYTSLSAGDPIDELPFSHKAVPAEVLDAITNAGGRWVPVSKGGRSPASAVSLLKTAAEKAGLSVEVATKNGEVYARTSEAKTKTATKAQGKPAAKKAAATKAATVPVRRTKATT